jgi:hypothetical protein
MVSISEFAEPLISQHSSYPVPKEVGKVGAESSTFIEPISHRKDGIHAMFSKQNAKQNSPAGKRKRSSSVLTIDISLERQASSNKGSGSPSKKTKSEEDMRGKATTYPDDSPSLQSQKVSLSGPRGLSLPTHWKSQATTVESKPPSPSKSKSKVHIVSAQIVTLGLMLYRFPIPGVGHQR